MNERLTTRDLADVLALQTGMDKKHADDLINALSTYISQRIEKNKSVRVIGLGTFKVVLVRERESVHIQTGERFIIPAHHKLSFIPDKDFKEHINRPFAFFEPIETVEEERKPKKVSFNINKNTESVVSNQDEIVADEVEVLDKELVNAQDQSAETEEHSEIPVAAVVVNQSDNDYFSNEEYASISVEEREEIVASEEIKDNDLTEAEDPEDYVEPVLIVDTDESDEYNETEEEDDIDESELAEIYNSTVNAEDNNGRFEIVEPVLNTKTSPEEKKRTVPSWFLYVVIPVLAFLGSFLAVFLFLHYNTDKSLVNDRPLNVLTYEPDATAGIPLPEENTEIQDTGKIDNILSIDGFTFPDSSGDDIAQSDVTDSIKTSTETNTTDRTAKNWLTPLPETANAQTKRANKPNEEIERRNRDLARTTTAGTGTTGNTRTTDAGAAKTTTTGTNAAQPETKEKTIPAKIRLTAGASLRQIAEEYYGDRVFWVYIYEYNKDIIKNYNNIPVGTEIRMPLPRTYGINANNQSSKQKAEQRQTELYRNNPGN